MSEQSDDALNCFTPLDQDTFTHSDKMKSAPETEHFNHSPPVNSNPSEPVGPNDRSPAAPAPISDKYALLFDYAPNGYLTLNDSALICEVNLTLANWLGQDKKALKGISIYQHIDPKFHAALSTHLKTVLSGGRRHNCTLRLNTQSQRQIPVNFESIALRDSRGQLSQVFCTITDINPLQKQIESDQIQKTVSEISGQAFLSTDKQLKITHWNKAAQELFGWSADEILAQSSQSRLQTQILEPLISQDMMHHLEAGGIWSGHVKCQHKDNSKFNASVAIGVIWDTLGSFNGLVAVFDRPDSPATSPAAPKETVNLEQMVKERTEELTRTVSILRQEITHQKKASLATCDADGKTVIWLTI